MNLWNLYVLSVWGQLLNRLTYDLKNILTHSVTYLNIIKGEFYLIKKFSKP